GRRRKTSISSLPGWARAVKNRPAAAMDAAVTALALLKMDMQGSALTCRKSIAERCEQPRHSEVNFKHENSGRRGRKTDCRLFVARPGERRIRCRRGRRRRGGRRNGACDGVRFDYSRPGIAGYGWHDGAKENSHAQDQ